MKNGTTWSQLGAVALQQHNNTVRNDFRSIYHLPMRLAPRLYDRFTPAPHALLLPCLPHHILADRQLDLLERRQIRREVDILRDLLRGRLEELCHILRR